MGFELPRRANAQNSAPVITTLAVIAPMTPQPYGVNSFPYLMRGRSESITSSKVLSSEKSATKRLAMVPRRDGSRSRPRVARNVWTRG